MIGSGRVLSWPFSAFQRLSNSQFGESNTGWATHGVSGRGTNKDFQGVILALHGYPELGNNTTALITVPTLVSTN